MVIEQEQILTTHNLAVLMQTLGLIDVLGPQLEELARRCFVWICQRQQQKITAWQPRLRMIKNCAYAWRQMVFFLALLPDETVRTFLNWADAHLDDAVAKLRALRRNYGQWLAVAKAHREDILARYSPAALLAQLQAALAG
jgi:hypothetical protein